MAYDLYAMAIVCFLGACLAACGVNPTTPPQVDPSGTDEPDKPSFTWKAVWVWLPADASLEKVKQAVALAHETGFNAIIVNIQAGRQASYASGILPRPANAKTDVLELAAKEARARGMEIYAWITYLFNSGGEELWQEHPELFQVLKPEQEALVGKRSSPDRVDVYTGHWLCPDRGLQEDERLITEEIVKNYDIDGVAIDFLGYRNYQACFCEFSNERRAEFARRHPQLAEQEVLRLYSTESLVNWTRQLRRCVLDLKPELKLAIHIYPDFDLDPTYGSLLPVEHCGQTIAWFYTPHWSNEKVREKERMYRAAEGKACPFNHHVSFIGCRGGKLAKSPEKLRDELRIAGAGGHREVMFAFMATLESNPELTQVLREELKASDTESPDSIDH